MSDKLSNKGELKADESAADESSRYEALIPDINGLFRGLSLPVADAAELEAGGFTITGSLMSSDFRGCVVEGTGYGLERGDPDHPCVLVAGTSAAAPWRAGDRQGVYRMLSRDGAADFVLDPQSVLAAVAERFAAEGLRVCCAVELEFYAHRAGALPRIAAGSGAAVPHLYAMEHDKDEMMRAIVAAAAAQGIATGGVVSEYGPGQWEINLRHTDPMRAALEGLLFRRTARAVARRFGERVTFMAKPYAGLSGSGMHIHCSVYEGGGGNVLADAGRMRAAAAGAAAVLPEAMAFFAPFDNSYRRFGAGTYAPVAAAVGEDDRSAALRIPSGADCANCRLECRVAGADANPLLVIAALLAGIHWGLSGGAAGVKKAAAASAGSARSAAVAKNAEMAKKPSESPAALPPPLPLPLTWRGALDALVVAEILPRYIDREFLRVYAAVKESEWMHHRGFVSDYDRDFYHSVL